MTIARVCPACGEGQIAERRYERDLEYKGVDLHVAGLVHYVCQSCEYAFESHEQHDSNIDTIRGAFVAERVAFKVANDLLTGQVIRNVRKYLELTQQEAAELFGGGVNAFSKYENEEIVQSFSMDRLIRLVAYLGKPGLEALKMANVVASSAFVVASSTFGMLRQANTATSGQVAILHTSNNLPASLKGTLGEPQLLFATIPNFQANAWSPQPAEWPELVMHNSVAGASRAQVFDVKSTNVRLIPGSESRTEVRTFGRNPLTGALFPMKRGIERKERVNEIRA